MEILTSRDKFHFHKEYLVDQSNNSAKLKYSVDPAKNKVWEKISGESSKIKQKSSKKKKFKNQKKFNTKIQKSKNSSTNYKFQKSQKSSKIKKKFKQL